MLLSSAETVSLSNLLPDTGLVTENFWLVDPFVEDVSVLSEVELIGLAAELNPEPTFPDCKFTVSFPSES